MSPVSYTRPLRYTQFGMRAQIFNGVATYKTSYEVKDGQLVFTRSLAQRTGSIPVEQYQAVRRFFEKIRALNKRQWC